MGTLTGIRIDTWWFITVLALVTVACAAATALGWDRPRWRTVRRTAGLLLTQLLVLATLGALVNRGADFYVTVGDLFGGDADGAHAATVPPGTPVLSPDGAGSAEFGRWLAAQHRAGPPDAGVDVLVVIAGGRTGYRLPARIHVPAPYFSAAYARHSFATLTLLAGYPGSVHNWSRTMGVGPLLDAAIASRTIAPVVAVMPEQNPVRGRDSECVDSADGVRADTFLTTDVPAVLARYLRIVDDRAGRALAGYSTGGFCAVNLALRHADRYAAAVALSAHFRPLVDRSTGRLYRDDPALRDANDPRLTMARAARPVDLYLFASRQDRSAQQELDAFRPLVRPPHTATVVADRPGGHNFRTWRREVPHLLRWLGDRMTGPRPCARACMSRVRPGRSRSSTAPAPPGCADPA